MSKGKKLLELDNVKYDWDNLLLKYCEGDIAEGEVVDLESGEVFSITELPDKYLERNEGILDISNHLTYSQKSKIRKVLNYQINKFRIKILYTKLEEGVITKEQLEEYILLDEGRNIKEEIEKNDGVSANLINKFVKVNQEFPLPKEVKLVSVGRYYRLLEVLIHKNKVFNKPHGNSKEPSKSELMTYLECRSDNTFKDFIQEMEKFDIARRFKLPNSRNIIFINPLYAHKDLIISRELYNVFKDVLEVKLKKSIVKYLEFIYESEVSGSITYTEN